MADDVNALGAGDPAGTDPNNVPGDLQDLKDKINAGSIARRLTQAQIDALPATQKPVGVVVHNSTAGRLQRWDGAKWVTLLDSATNPVISNTWPALLLNSTDGSPSQVAFLVGGAVRWMLYHRASSTGELVVDRYSSSGVYQGTPLAIAPSGAIAFQDAPAHPDAAASGESATLGQVESAAATVAAAASAAQSTANAALSNAAAAQSTANGATSAASAAQGTANNAVTKADAAQSTANTAASNADAAQSTANAALPKAGGVLTGPLILDSDNGWRVLGSAGGVFAVQRRDPATGAYVDNPLLITAAGHVESRSHIAGTHSGTTNPAGYLNMTIGASPTGTWIVVANAQVTATGAPIACTAVQTAATTITFTVPNASTAIQLSWHAIAV